MAAALMAEGESLLRGIEPCDDTHYALECIRALGAEVRQVDDTTLRIVGGLNPVTDTLRVGESGLASRLFTPIAALHGGEMRIEGHGTLLLRPMQPMLKVLGELGVASTSDNGRLPIVLQGGLRGGEARLDGSVSSQFLTGLLLALPCAEGDTTLRVDDAVSIPYIEMTLDTAERFGVEIFRRGYEEFFIAGGQRYRPAEMQIEGDWSAAAMMLVAGATAGSVRVENMNMLSRQADRAICDALIRAGAAVESDAESITVSRRELRAFEFDATHCPDLFPALAALAAAAEGESVIHGAHRLKHKESSRAEVLREEYAKIGIEILIEGDTMFVRGGAICSATVSSHHDHRIAMSLAVAALRADTALTITDAECVTKSYPRFFEELARIENQADCQ